MSAQALLRCIVDLYHPLLNVLIIKRITNLGLISFQNEQAIHTQDRLISKDEIKAVVTGVKKVG